VTVSTLLTSVVETKSAHASPVIYSIPAILIRPCTERCNSKHL